VLYLAQLPNFMEWVVQRIYSNSSLYIGRVALKTLYLYLTIICFIYINHILPVIVFENISLCHILDGVTSLNLNPKEATPKLPISYNILAKIIISSNLILGVNTNTTFYLDFTGCLCIREISYTDKQWFELLFTATKATHLDI
jgi:hypothetical protein